jgi:aminomethyltransferase
MVPFAGYDMPVQYPMGVLKEHLHCRAQAGLFDVSHMGQVILRPTGSMEGW